MSTPMYDAVIIGSGAGGASVAYTLTKAGFHVALLEKGDFLKRSDFSKDELAYCRRDIITPDLFNEYHIIAQEQNGRWVETPTYESGWSFWNGNIVGGSSNLMSGMFHRMHPDDFHLLQKYGPIEGANIADWPITYEALEPYYTKVESLIGVSGKFIPHPFEPPRSHPDYPFPPTKENGVVSLFDKSCRSLKITPLVTPRAILSQDTSDRNACYYSNYCGSYGCSSGAKGSAREALIVPALSTGKLTLLSHTHVTQLLSHTKESVETAQCVNTVTKERFSISGRIFIVAAQAHESVRLLFNSANRFHPNGLGNTHGQLGKNLIFSGGGAGEGVLHTRTLQDISPQTLMQPGYFFNRSLLDWYYIDEWWDGRFKGGLIEFMFSHANIISQALRHTYHEGQLQWGEALANRLQKTFTQQRAIRFEIFNDWLPTDKCFIQVAPDHKDIYGMPVGKLHIWGHPHDIKVGNYLAQKATNILEAMGAKQIYSDISATPAPNLIAGGCRFGNDPRTSVLDPDCRVHDIKNLYVTDASFMPTGGSVPYTWTIYANALRVADKIVAHLHDL